MLKVSGISMHPLSHVMWLRYVALKCLLYIFLSARIVFILFYQKYKNVIEMQLIIIIVVVVVVIYNTEQTNEKQKTRQT